MENIKCTHSPFGEIVEKTELRVDQDRVSVPMEKYEELIRASADRDVLQRAYQNCGAYNLNEVMVAVFGPLPPKKEEAKKEEGNA